MGSHDISLALLEPAKHSTSFHFGLIGARSLGILSILRKTGVLISNSNDEIINPFPDCAPRTVIGCRREEARDSPALFNYVSTLPRSS